MDFIRSGFLCIILTSLTEITALVHLYKVSLTLYIIDQVVGVIRSDPLCIISTGLAKTPGLVGFITSGRLCIMLTGLTKITEH